MYRHVKEMQFPARPDAPDALYAMKFQEILGGTYGEMTVMMQYMWQGFACRVPGKYKDMIMDIGAEEMGHVEMLATMLARLLEGAPAETTEKAAAGNPALAAVLGGMNPQHAIVAGGGAMPTNSQGVPWSAANIIASGNLLADFRSNAAVEAQGRLQTSRLYGMTDDSGVKAMLAYNLARDTFHQQQWLLAIEELVEEGYAETIEHSHAAEEDDLQNHTFWSINAGSTADQGRWATGTMPDGTPIEFLRDAQPASDDDGTTPAPDPELFATRDPSAPAGASGRVDGRSPSIGDRIRDAL